MTTRGLAPIVLSFDVDWASDAVIRDSLDLLDRHRAKATFFATHRTPALEGLDRDRYEIGVHPDFNPLLDGRAAGGPKRTFEDVLSEAKAMYPDVVGMRSHGVVSSGPILYAAARMGFLYESNMYLPHAIAPFRDYDGLIRAPMFWSDYRELLVGTPYDADQLDLSEPAPYVFAFHPFHVFMNSASPDHARGGRGKKDDELLRLRHTGPGKGPRDFSLDLLARVAKEGHPVVTLGELCREHERAHGTAVAVHARR